MKCARLRLQERSSTSGKYRQAITSDKPRRYCQKRLLDPDHEEDPRWIDVFQRFHCHGNENDIHVNNTTVAQDEDLFLTVQNLKFLGIDHERKRPRTSFKYKTIKSGKRHRMFVKQVVTEPEPVEEDRASQLSCYYFTDYARYLSHSDRSRPSSGKSSIGLQGLGAKFKENKTVQVDIAKLRDTKQTSKGAKGNSQILDKQSQQLKDCEEELHDTSIQNTKITFHKSGNRKSLTISRAQSPETVQIIRVDVVCNYSTSSTLSDYEDKKSSQSAIVQVDKIIDSRNVSLKKSHFGQKYLLTNAIKTLDENVSGGAKVTLLCKTFTLSDRTKMLSQNHVSKGTKSKVYK